MTKFAAFSLLLIVLVIFSIYKVNSAPNPFPIPKPFIPQGGYQLVVGEKGPLIYQNLLPKGFRALGVNYFYITYISYLYYSILIIAGMVN